MASGTENSSHDKAPAEPLQQNGGSEVFYQEHLQHSSLFLFTALLYAVIYRFAPFAFFCAAFFITSPAAFRFRHRSTVSL